MVNSTKLRTLSALLAGLAYIGSVSNVFAAPTACNGISKKCNPAYGKVIKGKKYSCQACTQTMCSGGSTIVGTSTTTTCTEKAISNTGTPGRAISNKPGTKAAPRKGISPRNATSRPNKMRQNAKRKVIVTKKWKPIRRPFQSKRTNVKKRIPRGFTGRPSIKINRKPAYLISVSDCRSFNGKVVKSGWCPSGSYCKLNGIKNCTAPKTKR